MPFVALSISENEGEGARSKDSIKTFLAYSVGAWLLLNVVFFCNIDLSFAGTFFGTKTASQYTIELFKESKVDSSKFRAAFKKRASYTKPVHADVLKWVAENLDRWRNEKEEWFNQDLIPDAFLPNMVGNEVILWRRLANELYGKRTNNHKSNLLIIDRFLNGHSVQFSLLQAKCPKFKVILSHVLLLRFGGVTVKKTSNVDDASGWTDEVSLQLCLA